VARERDAFDAVTSGDAPRLRELLGDDPALAGARDDDGVSLLLRARYAMDDALVEAVLEARPELGVHEAAAVGDAARLRALLGAEPQLARAVAADGFTPLHLAAFFGQPHAVRLLLERGADPEAVAANATAVTPLHSAAAADDREAARLLLVAGADPNARQRGGYAPLHSAAAAGDGELAQLLLENGADPGLASDGGATAADLARERGHEDLADALGG
jgi:ankyrin repeat protein